MTLKQQLIIYLFIFFFHHFLGSRLFCDGVRTWRWSHDAHPRRSIHRATNHVLLWLCHPRSPILARPRNCVQGLEVGQLAARRRGLRQNRRFRAVQRGHGFRTADWNFLRDAWVSCTWGMSFLIFFFAKVRSWPAVILFWFFGLIDFTFRCVSCWRRTILSEKVLNFHTFFKNPLM